MPVDVILGLQWGDEGKGKLVDAIAPDYDVVARFQGGANAGHTLVIERKKYVLHLMPSGIFHPNCKNLIGNGVVLDSVILQDEVNKLLLLDSDILSRLYISKKATLILPTHKLLDKLQEESKGDKKIGSTLKGIGPAYQDKIGRNCLKVGDILKPNFLEKYQNIKNRHLKLAEFWSSNVEFDVQFEEQFFQSIEFLRNLQLVNSEIWLLPILKNGGKVLAEGAQGSMLDVDFGSYPFVTSSNTTIGGVCTGLGVPPSEVRDVLGVFKAYCTRVGSGPFPTELHDETGELLRKEGREFGATTGRPRRTGWLDLPSLHYACMINGVTRLAMMKSDVLSVLEAIQVCTAYQTENGITEIADDSTQIEPIYREFQGWHKNDFSNLQIPETMKKYVQFIEKTVQVPVKILSIGPDRAETIYL